MACILRGILLMSFFEEWPRDMEEQNGSLLCYHQIHLPVIVKMIYDSATCKAIRRIWNITIYRLVVMSETIHRTVCRKPKERGNLHVGIWIIVPAPTVVSGQVLLDCDPGALCSVHDSQLQLETCS